MMINEFAFALNKLEKRYQMAIRLLRSFKQDLAWKRELGWLASTRREQWLAEVAEDLDRQVEELYSEHFTF